MQSVASDLYYNVRLDELVTERILERAPWWFDPVQFTEHVKQRVARMTEDELLPWHTTEYSDDDIVDLGIAIVRFIFQDQKIDVSLQESFSTLVRLAKKQDNSDQILKVVHLMIDQGERSVFRDENVKMANYIFKLLSLS